MSHHSSNPEHDQRMHEMMGKLLGEFPHGKLNKEDEGALALSIGVEAGAIKIAFPKPVAWIAFTPEEAFDIANALIKHARACGLKTVKTITL